MWRLPQSFRILSALLTLTAACSRPEAATPGARAVKPAPRQVTTAQAVEKPLERLVTVNGTLAAEDQIALAFKVAGRVQSVAVDLGSPVQEGQIVARLSPTDYELRVEQARAALEQARVRLGLQPAGDKDDVDINATALVRQRRATLQQARLNRERMKAFFDRGITSKASLDDADAALEVAEGQHQDALEEIRNRQGVLEQRRTELDIARQQLEDTVLRSPISGAVRERQVTEGEYRTAGTPVLTIVRTDPLRLRVAVPERSAVGLRAGEEVRVHVQGDTQSYEGRLARIGAAIDESNRTLPVEAVVSNRAGTIRPGQFATADIVVGHGERAVMVPADAIVSFAGVPRVLTVDKGKAHEQRVRTGRREGDEVEILEGLRAGETVIRTPGDVVDGATVSVRTE